jgi:5-methylcytosine-specific restriction enzyme subunit McrC
MSTTTMTSKTDVAQRVTLQEWERRGPDTDPELAGAVFAGNECEAVRALHERGMLRVAELRGGVELRSTSFVGHVRLGNLDVTIRPKIGWDGLLRLARYAYGIRAQDVGPRLQVALERDSLADLLVLQLCEEARSLAARGRHRSYRVKRVVLTVPRGRLDVPRLAMREVSARPGLPCVVRPRSEDVLLNRMVLAGLRLGARVAAVPEVKDEAARAAAMWAVDVTDVRTDRHDVERATRELNRLTENYGPALRLVDALMAGSGASLQDEPRRLPLQGFLFDMNRFFQHFLSRFLHEFLDGFVVRDEHMLRHMLSYAAGANPRRRSAPTPRPDFAVQNGGRTVALLDAKYRDLWETALPREMLYQLTTYALSQPEGFEAAILYPSLAERAGVQRIEIKDPTSARVRATVALRPVPVGRLEVLAGPMTTAQRAECRRLARFLALGAA